MCYNSGRGILIKVGVSRMINIAIVEDEKIYSDQIKEYLDFIKGIRTRLSDSI